jgi:hypothetical protein
MTTYYLLTTVSTGKTQYKSGSTINSLLHNVAEIQSAGGVLVATASFPGLATQAANVLTMQRARAQPSATRR